MLTQLLWLAAGLVLLVAGGEALVRGAASLARRLGVPPIAIGLTVVAFGTSAPELAVCLIAALEGNPEIAFGNVVGSNCANIGLLLGLTALITPLAVHSQIVLREIPMMLLASAVAFAIGADALLSGGDDVLSHGDGAVLLLTFCVFLYYTTADLLRGRRRDALVTEAAADSSQRQEASLVTAIVLVACGLAALVVGGRWLVVAAVEIARGLAVPEIVIGSTIVAVGTSLPELVTCIVAARKGMSDIAIGNIVGSNIFNLLFVLGLTAAIKPVPLPAGAPIDIAVMLAFAAVLLPMAISDRRSITRTEGIVLLIGYAGYAVWQSTR